MAISIGTHIHAQIAFLRESWKTLLTNKVVTISTYGGLVFPLVGMVIIAVVWNTLPPVIPIWFSKPWGVERLSPTGWLFILPLSSFLITAINAYIAAFLIKEYLVFSQIISLSSIVISMLSIFSLVKIIFMVM